MLRVRIGGLVFEDFPSDLSQGFVISPNGWSGWDEGVDVRRDEKVRPVSHGAFDAVGYLGARVVTIAGNIIASSPVELEHMRARLTGLLADGSTGRLVVDSDMGSTWADVRLASRTSVKVSGASGMEAEFQISFWAPDMRKYGETRTFTGPTASAYHYGNFPASPVIEVTGSMASGYTVASQGRSFIVSQALTSGHTHRIDMRSGWLFLDDVLQTGAVSQARTFQIPPGAPATVAFTPVSGSGVMSVKVTDTYV